MSEQSQAPTWENSAPVEEQPNRAPATPQMQNPAGEPVPTWENTEDLQDKYGTAEQHVKTIAEGVGQGLLGPVASYFEKNLGVKPEDIRNRAETHPIEHGVSEALGLGAGAALGSGEGAALGIAGKGVEAGLGALGVGKIGSKIAADAVEFGLYQAGQEVNRHVLEDPNSTETAIANIGMSALMGGTFGSISPLWKATLGPKVESVLTKISDKLGGIEGIVPESVDTHIANSGLNVPPELRAAMTQDPLLNNLYSRLNQTDVNASGRAVQEAGKALRNEAGDALASSLGVLPGEAVKIGEISTYDFGKELGNTLAKEYDKSLNPVSKVFDELKGKFKGIELPSETLNAAGDKVPSTTDSIASKLLQKAMDEGWTTSPSSDIMKEVTRTLKELPLQKNLKNLSDFITQVGKNTASDPLNKELRRAGSIMTGIMKEAEGDVIASKLGETEGGAAVEAFKQARQAYAAQSALKEALDSRLGVGGSTSGFGKELRKMAQTDGEAVLRRLSGKNDADLLNFLKQNYPETASVLQRYHASSILKSAADKAESGVGISAGEFLKKYNALSPELKDFITTPEGKVRVGAVDSILSELNKPNHNYSNTGRTVDAFLEHVTGTTVGMAALLHGYNPLVSGLVGYLAKVVGRDAPDAARLALLRYLGTAKNIDASGFKSAVELIHNTLRGENQVSKAVANVLKPSAEVLPHHLLPTDSDRKNLKKSVDTYTTKPEEMLNMTGSTGHYMPEHATQLSKTAATAANLIRNLRPDTAPKSPLDVKREPSSVEKAQYNRLVDLAQQPLLVLQYIKDGTLTPRDMEIHKTIYPSMYNKISAKLLDEVSKTVSKGSSIPYKTRLGLSLYLGQALDSTMKPGSIIAAQPKPQQNQQQTATQPASNPKHSTNALNKLPKMYSTPGQTAERDRSNRE